MTQVPGITVQPKSRELFSQKDVSPQLVRDYARLLKETPRLVDAGGREFKPAQPEQWLGRTDSERKQVKANIDGVVQQMETRLAQLELSSKFPMLSLFHLPESGYSPATRTHGVDPRVIGSVRGIVERLHWIQRVIEPGLGSRDDPPEVRAEKEKIIAELIQNDSTLRIMLFRPCVTTQLACGGGWNYGQRTAAPPTIDWNQIGAANETRSASAKAVGSISAMTKRKPPFDLRPRRTPIGTGFVVRPFLVMTNLHVVADLESPILVGTGRDAKGLDLEGEAFPEIDFINEDCPSEPSLTARITEVAFVHPTLDVALVRIGPLMHRSSPDAPSVAAPNLEPKPLTLRRSSTMPGKDQFVALVGYPLGCRENEIDQEQCRIIFMDGSKLGTRRIAPGAIIQSAIQTDPHRNTPAWRHDCTTLYGSSGAPVIDLQTCHVVALHYESETENDPAKRIGNLAIPICELAREPRLTTGDLALSWVD